MIALGAVTAYLFGLCAATERQCLQTGMGSEERFALFCALAVAGLAIMAVFW